MEMDESQLPGEMPGNYVLRLAESKARKCAASYKNDGAVPSNKELTILAADTAVVDDETILGKPRDSADAAKMLRQLRGHTHKVYTGITIIRTSNGNMGKDLCVTDVPMRGYSREEIETYVDSGDPLDKAGAYAIQHPGFHPVEIFAGCYASVMGLPLCHLTRTLRKFNISPTTDISAKCQTYLNYKCPISNAVLRGEQIG